MASRAQDDPGQSTVVDLKDRQLIEQAAAKLRAKWLQRGKPPAAGVATTVPQSAQPNLLMSPADENALELKLTPPQRQSLARKTLSTFVEPETKRSKAGKLSLKLDVAYAHNRIGDDPVHLRAFNGKLYGPTLRVKPGDKVRIVVHNSLPPERWVADSMNTLHGFNTLNMHYHGLHISPNGISDNVLIQIGPAETQEYFLEIPADHTTGTYWYHPHLHGSTAGTVASGLSGALIIEGGLDDVPEIKAAKDRVMILNQIPYVYKNTFVDTTTTPPTTNTFDLKEGEVEAKYANYIFGFNDWAGMGRYTTVNGVELPVIRLRPGQIERWRLVDSGQREMIMLKIIPNPKAGGSSLPAMPFHEIAVDGLALGKVVTTNQVELWPGYRSDVLVQAPLSPGEYLLIDDAVPASNTISGQDKPLNYVARIVVEGRRVDMKLPSSGQLAGLRLPSIKTNDIKGFPVVNYGILKTASGNSFDIDGKSFDMETARELQLNDTDEWTIHSINDVGLVTHPFHIHVNPFEVISIMSPLNGDTNHLVEELTDGPVWRDTVKIPGGGYVKMRTHYADFIGTFVQHCHILDHEDQGMMELVDIVEKKGGTASRGRGVPAVGTSAPDFAFLDEKGQNRSISDFNGKPTVVFFFKGYGCLHCARQVKAFAENYEAFAKLGVHLVGVTTDDAEVVKSSQEKSALPFAILPDPQGAIFAKYGCTDGTGLLHGTFCLDAQGKVTWSTVTGSPYLDVRRLVERMANITATVSAGAPGLENSSAGSGVLAQSQGKLRN
ncbi:MAG TPA: redoxin domain-containing protein [Candidatus Limnocylindria bacterium]|nr:redoxin domain-containing protein [Candidatus Limnocylindria bacterium]